MDTLIEELGISQATIKRDLDYMKDRLNALMRSQYDSAEEIRKRIRILQMTARTEYPEHFESVASATIKRRRLRVRYHAAPVTRSRNVRSRLSDCCITATTGTSAAGVTCARVCGVFRGCNSLG
jgi:predicted DNA-binding transcriptional regulator YafY